MKEVIPFSNGTEADYWQMNNCHNCKKYEFESTDIHEAGCLLAFELDFGRISGTISLKTAKRIGIASQEGDYVTLLNQCKELEKDD